MVWRAGIDLNPLEVDSDTDVAWLEALIWPEHTGRQEQLRAAVDVVRAERINATGTGTSGPVVRGDLVSTIEALVGQAPAGTHVIVFHTAVLLYLEAEAREQFAETMARLPVTWIANEAPRFVPGVIDKLAGAGPRASSDFVLTINGDPVAFTHPHGKTLRWFA